MYYLVQINDKKISYLQVPSHPCQALKNLPLTCCSKSLIYPTYVDERKDVVARIVPLKNRNYIPLFDININDLLNGQSVILKWKIIQNSINISQESIGKLFNDMGINTNFITIDYFNHCKETQLSNPGYGSLFTLINHPYGSGCHNHNVASLDQTDMNDSDSPYIWKYGIGDSDHKFYLIKNLLNKVNSEDTKINYLQSDDLNENEVIQMVNNKSFHENFIPITCVSHTF